MMISPILDVTAPSQCLIAAQYLSSNSGDTVNTPAPLDASLKAIFMKALEPRTDTDTTPRSFRPSSSRTTGFVPSSLTVILNRFST